MHAWNTKIRDIMRSYFSKIWPNYSKYAVMVCGRVFHKVRQQGEGQIFTRIIGILFSNKRLLFYIVILLFILLFYHFVLRGGGSDVSKFSDSRKRLLLKLFFCDKVYFMLNYKFPKIVMQKIVSSVTGKSVPSS